MKRNVLSILIVVTLLISMNIPVYGAQAGSYVGVTLPSFPVTLNGITVNNTYSKYPIIVYKGITYFPMTYNNCRFLGLECFWKGNAEGLSVETTGETAAYYPNKRSTKNSSSQRAVIPAFPIKVNGKVVDNSKEMYPLLSFRDITYFPMTWRYGVDEFGWDYSYNSKDGLVIKSHNIKLDQKTIPSNMAKNEDGTFRNNVIVTDKYAYFEDSKGCIIQESLLDTTKTKTVYQLPIWSYGDGKTYVNPSLYTKDRQVFMYYHDGGAIMGADFLFQLKDDGNVVELSDNREIIKTFGDKSFSYYVGPMPGAGNLSMKTGNGDRKQIGSYDYIYGWAWKANDGMIGGSSSEDAYLVEDDLYILAFDMTAKNATTGVYKVNINTNETIRVTEKEVLAFQIEGGYLYYQNEGSVYRIALKDGREELLKQLVKVPNSIKSFYALNGNIYWQDVVNLNLYDINGKNLNCDAMLDDMKIAGDNNEYLVCTFQETSKSIYRIMVFNKNGAVVFKTSDKSYCKNINIVGNVIYFYNITTRTICVGQLT
jgi:hypothetical protein